MLSLHGLARLAVRTGGGIYLRRVRACLRGFWEGRMLWKANFPNYFCGGNAAAYLYWKGHLPEAREAIRLRTEEQSVQPRDRAGLFSHPKGQPNSQRVWIDTLFAVTPFYLYAGLALERADWVDEAVHQALGHYEVLRNGQTGLLHQSRDFAGPGQLSDDHWSRGNGWGLHALSALILDLPEAHPRRAEVEQTYRAHIKAVLALQGEEGLWHQEMTAPESYIETSGSFLILQALGAGIETGVLEDSHRDPLHHGLRGGMEYITSEGSVFHCCQGCLCPGDGSKQAYMAQGPRLNDSHAFGPVIHACEQAIGVFGRD